MRRTMVGPTAVIVFAVTLMVTLPSLPASAGHVSPPIVFEVSMDNPTFQVFSIQPDGTELTQLTDTPDANNDSPTWASDLSAIYFIYVGSGTHPTRSIRRMDPDGSNPVDLYSTTTQQIFDVAASPDGQRLVFSRSTATGISLFLMNVDGTNVERFTTKQQAMDTFATWSPDGTKIAWERDVPGQTSSRIVVKHVIGGGGVTPLTPADKVSQSPHYSPDGTEIAYTKAIGVQQTLGRVMVMDADGTNDHVVTNNAKGTYYSAAGWSPDGSQLLFVGGPTGSMEESSLFVISPIGTGQFKVTPDDLVVVIGSWAPA